MTDQELLEISGKISYEDAYVGKPFRINEIDYTVLDVYDDKSGNGLQAMTLIRKDGVVVIAYQGTNPDEMNDLLTDVILMSNNTPMQFENARRYYEEMSANYKISYVCGNSLGGGLANYVAIKYPEVKSVTYNPAILPKNVDTGIRYSNIKNYLGAYDPLTILEIAAGYEQYIPGQVVMTRDNIPSITFFLANHVGYIETNEIKLQGGNVPVKVNLLNGLPFSVFSNDYLDYNYKGTGQRIEINVNTILSLKNGISRLIENVSYAQRYLDESLKIIQTEGSHLYNRIEELDADNDDIFKLFGLDIIAIVDEIETELNNMDPILRTIYDIVEKINSIPIISDVFGWIVSLNPVSNLLTIAPEIIITAGDLLDSYSQFKRVGIPALFKDVDKIFDDGLPTKLKKHTEIINENKNLMMERLNTYLLQVEGIWNTMSEADLSYFNIKQVSIAAVPVMNNTALTKNKEIENIVEEKNKQLNENYANFSKLMRNELSETLSSLYRLLYRFGEGIRDLHGFVETIERIAHYADIPIISWDDDFFRDIYNNIKVARIDLDKYLNALDGVTNVLGVADSRLDEILITIKPYIKNAIFGNKKYENVIIYNLASYNIYECTSVTFTEIEYQLSENEAESIQLLSDNARLLKSDMQLLMRQIKKGTIC